MFDNQTHSFIQQQSIMVLATLDGTQPYLTPVFFYYDADNSVFYFITKRTSRKCINILHTHDVGLTIFSETPPVVFTAQGHAEVLTISIPEHKPIIDTLITIHSTREYYPTPFRSLEQGEFALVKITLTHHEFDSFQNNV